MCVSLLKKSFVFHLLWIAWLTKLLLQRVQTIDYMVIWLVEMEIPFLLCNLICFIPVLAALRKDKIAYDHKWQSLTSVTEECEFIEHHVAFITLTGVFDTSRNYLTLGYKK